MGQKTELTIADQRLLETVWDAIAEGKSVIGAVRVYRGLSPVELERTAGLGTEVIEALEAGIRPPSHDLLSAIASVLQVPSALLAE